MKVEKATEDNQWTWLARHWTKRSFCQKKKVAAVVVREGYTDAVLVQDGRVIGRGVNGPLLPVKGCPRMDFESGTGYELCWENCCRDTHAEEAAIQDTLENAPLTAEPFKDESGKPATTLYVAGHDHCCDDCLLLAEQVGIRRVVIVSES